MHSFTIRLLFLGCFFHISVSNAQLRFEPFNSLEAQAGVSRFIGDLAPISQAFQGYRWGTAVGGLRQINPYIRAGMSFSWTRLGADDFFSTNDVSFARNLHVRNDVKSVQIEARYYLIPFESNYRRSSSSVYPYLSLGAGYLWHNPMARLPVSAGREWVDLQPLGTEGQGLNPSFEAPYKKRTYQLPIGVGIEVIKGNYTFGVSAELRFTGTDYLDDVRGDFANPSLTRNPAIEVPTELMNDRVVWGTMLQRQVEQTATRVNRDRVPRLRDFLASRGLPTGSETTTVLAIPELGVGAKRGTSIGNDAYVLIGFKIGYILPDGVRCP